MNEWEWHLLEDQAPVESVAVGGAELRKGDLVRLKPRKGGDIFDLALAGQAAVIESIEQDYEGKLHLAVVIEDDPGKDLGLLRQPGHRFFFAADEVEPLTRRILIAGIGNIFLGDDAFGVEVIRELSTRELPKGVEVRDFGIRGYDLAYALLDKYDTVILVDAAPRGDDAGTLYVIEPELGANPDTPPMDAHAMNPVSVLHLARTLGTVSAKILLVGCEPETLGGDDGHMGLSEPVSAAVSRAADLIEQLIQEKLVKGTGTI